MEEERDFILYEGVVVPESALLRRERENKYGSVPGLPDDELADPDELERQVYIEEFRPVLMLPERKRVSAIRPAIDESGQVDWGAFGTVDFDRYSVRFDKARYKVEKLRDELGDIAIMASIVKERIPKGKEQVLKYLLRGVIELEHITNEDMLTLAKLELRARRIRREIADLEDARARQGKRKLAKLLV